MCIACLLRVVGNPQVLKQISEVKPNHQLVLQLPPCDKLLMAHKKFGDNGMINTGVRQS
jgi:hypothetical protein